MSPGTVFGRFRDDDLREDAVLRVAYAEHGHVLLAVASRLLGDRSAAEDAVQETFLRAWRYAERFDPGRGSVRAWLFAILRNVVVDAQRARAARPVLLPAAADDRLEPAAGGRDELELALVSWQVEQALNRLSRAHRVALVEVYYRGRPPAEVAAELGVPAATVRTRVFYALRSLRVILEEMGWSDDG